MVPKFCGCRSSPQGDIISWDREAWTLRSPWNRSEAEMLDLERDVCDNREQGHFLVPHKHTFDEAVHVCRKLSGTLISYTDKAEFDDLISALRTGDVFGENMDKFKRNRKSRNSPPRVERMESFLRERSNERILAP